MNQWQKRLPLGHKLFMKIAEPRVVRLLYFGMYLGVISAGLMTMFNPPSYFESILGSTLVYVMGGFIFVGGVLSAFAVLPGIWWLERVGLLAIITGLLMYIVTATTGGSFAVAIIFITVRRWLEIRRYQLAPREG